MREPLRLLALLCDGHVLLDERQLESYRMGYRERVTDVIERRIANAKGEIEHCSQFDYVFVNDDFDLSSAPHAFDYAIASSLLRRLQGLLGFRPRCLACREGRDNLCENVAGVKGFHVDGFAQELRIHLGACRHRDHRQDVAGGKPEPVTREQYR